MNQEDKQKAITEYVGEDKDRAKTLRSLSQPKHHETRVDQQYAHIRLRQIAESVEKTINK